MKTVLKISILALLSNFGAFANDNPANAGDGTPKTRQEIEAALTNYRISCVIENEGKPAFHFFQASCEQGWAATITTDDKDLLAVNKAGKKVYMLDRNAKKGEWGPYVPEMEDYYKGGIYLAFFFIHTSYFNDSKFKRTDKIETVAGRKATVYTCEFADGVGTFWIDNEYGCTLKYVQVATQSGAYNIHAEVTEFKVGGVTVANMVNLSEYKLTKAKEN